MELIILWVLCAILGAAMLSNFNKAGTGLLLGFFLGPLGLLFALVVRSSAKSAEDKKEHEEQLAAMKEVADKSNSGSDTRECPFCAERIKRKAKLCRFCGKDLPEHDSSQLPEAPEGMISVAEYCDTNNRDESEVIDIIRKGKLQGRVVEGVWFVKP